MPKSSETLREQNVSFLLPDEYSTIIREQKHTYLLLGRTYSNTREQ